MVTFLVVLGIGIVAFADAFMSIYQALVLEGLMPENEDYNVDATNYEKYY